MNTFILNVCFSPHKQYLLFDLKSNCGIFSVQLYVPHDESDDSATFLFQLDECHNKKHLIPKNLPISIDVSKRNRHIEIIIFYEDKYDYYKINWNGIYCYRTLGTHQMSNRTVDEHIVECDT